jgi:hypothetical protein
MRRSKFQAFLGLLLMIGVGFALRLAFREPPANSLPREQTRRPPSETVADLLRRGGRVRLLDESELSADLQSRLWGLCRADSNIVGLWLAWITWTNEPPELLANLVVDRVDERTMADFIARADALGGPRFVVAFSEGIPSAKAFYRRPERNARPNDGRSAQDGDSEY